MSTVTCSRCKATTKANSIEDGRKRLDHGVGLYIGKPCEDGKAELFFTGNGNTKKIPDFNKKGKKIDKKTATSKSD